MANKWKKHLPSDVRSFRRPKESKRPSKAILILTEGVVTEPVYFETLKAKLALQTLEVEVKPQGKGDPRRLAESALEERADRRKAAKQNRLSYAQAPDFDEMWIVFDSDVPLEHHRYHDGVAFAVAKGVKCAQSTPCIEYWLLLHKTTTTAIMPKCKDVIPRLSDALETRYDKDGKESAKLIPPLLEHLSEAMRRAAQVRQGHRDAGTGEPANPSTDVDLLVRSLQDNAAPANG
jgi:hypothetical protein